MRLLKCAAVFLLFFTLNSELLTLNSYAFAGGKKAIKPSQKDKCPVCGMFVAKYPNWTAWIIFKNGSYVFFDGPKDMLKYYLNVTGYDPSRKSSDILSAYVTEYYSAESMPAEKMFFIKGSDIYGPMGDELIPVGTENRAKEFMKDHNGKKILRFNEITLEDLK